MLTVRLDIQFEKLLQQLSNKKGLSKSAIVKKALELYIEKEKQQTQSPYELGKDLFGTGKGGTRDASTQYKSILKEKLHGKHAH